MSVESNSEALHYTKYKEGLIYDAESVVLAGKHSDELSAHRAKRQWVGVFSSYFLLENERDYELWVTSDLAEEYFVVHCCFVSACGRYAFWRLVNQQAPEAEAKLGASLKNTTIKRLLAANRSAIRSGREPFVLSALSEQINQNNETQGLIRRILKLFN